MAQFRDRSLAFEKDENGKRVVIRSVRSIHKVYLRFTNKTGRTVDVWWRDYRGYRIHYLRFKARAFFDVTTYITHPWEFTDATTNEIYVVGNQRIFRTPKEFGAKPIRTNWNVTIGLRSLRRTALIKAASLIVDPKAATTLELPKILADELQKLVEMYHKQLVPDSRLDAMYFAREFVFRQWGAYFGGANHNNRP